jgi:hypothetical protein
MTILELFGMLAGLAMFTTTMIWLRLWRIDRHPINGVHQKKRNNVIGLGEVAEPDSK